MVSETAPWQAAFAAYDATAAGLLYGLCASEQVICSDSNDTIIVQPPSTNYGEILFDNMSVVVMGGPIPNWVVDYYERTAQTPLKVYIGATDWGFQTHGNVPVSTVPRSLDMAHNDLFIIEVFEDSHDNFVLVIYGLGWKGTFAGGVYVKEVISQDLASYTGDAYVFQWTDAGSNDGVPQKGEITQVYP